MEHKRFGALSSSVNPQELSLTFTSLVKTMAGLLVAFGVIGTTGADVLIEQAPVVVAASYSAYQAAEALWGAARKVVAAVYQQS